MVFKSLNGLVSEYLTSKFVRRNESNYALRDSVDKLVVPFLRTNYMKNSLVTAALPFATAYPVTLGSLVHYINLNAFSIVIFKHTTFTEIRFISRTSL